MPQNGRLSDHRRDPQNPSIRPLPIIALTAKAMKATARKCLEGRRVGLSAKPVQHRAVAPRHPYVLHR